MGKTQAATETEVVGRDEVTGAFGCGQWVIARPTFAGSQVQSRLLPLPEGSSFPFTHLSTTMQRYKRQQARGRRRWQDRERR